MRVMKFILGAVILLGLAVPSLAQTGLSGAWTVSFNGPNGPIEAEATFKQDGDKVTGSITGPAGETAFSGTAKGNTFNVSFSVQTQSGEISIKMSGEREGDSLKGTFDFGQGTGDYTGKRKK